MRNELPIDDFVTHTIVGLPNVNDAIDALHGGECLRAVVKINEIEPASKAPEFKQTSSVKVHGGFVK
jgi:hypothetical protein